MQNLIQLLIRYNAFFLFLLLEAVCFFLIVRFNTEQGKIYAATSNAFSGWFYDIKDDVTKHFTLEETADKLADDNTALFERLEESKFNNIIESDTAGNADYLQQYEFTSARVVNNSTNRPNNYLTINRGSNHGVRKHNAVIGGQGIVGIVLGVSGRYSRIMSILHQQAKVSVAIKNKGHFGSLVWPQVNSQYMEIEAIPKHANVMPGDTVITSGYSSMFPGGLTVGLVEEVKPIEGSSFFNISVKLTEDLNKVEYVYVVNNLFQQEQTELEEQVDNE